MEEEIDFERWHRELFKKFTTIRDAYEMNGIGNPENIKNAETVFAYAKNQKSKEFYEILSKILAKLMNDWDKKWNFLFYNRVIQVNTQ